MVDPSTHAIVCIDHSAHEICEGNKFYAEHVDAAMANAAKIEMLIVTPNSTKWAHAFIGVSVTGASTLQIYEAPTVTNPGTPLVKVNRNRNSDIAATVVITHTPATTDDGTLIQTKYCGATGKFSADGEDQRNENMWLLKQNTKYLVRLTADADGIKGKIFCNWCEHTYKGL